MKRPMHLAPRSTNPLSTAMTPMIDVVFLLLIFFLCTATFETPEEDLAASLIVPIEQVGNTATETPLPELDEVVVVGNRINETTIWSVNDGVQADSVEQLKALLKQLVGIERSLPVTIDADAAVPLGDVVTAYDAAREAGFDRVLLTTSAEALNQPGAAP